MNSNLLLLLSPWRSLFLLFSLLILGWHNGARADTTANNNDYALQTGPDSRGSTYAGGLVYNPNTNLIYVTGATYGRFFQNDFSALNATNNNPTSACFLGMVTGPSDNPKVLPQWLFASTFESAESANANEECNSLSLLGDSRMFMAGSSSEGGILASLRRPGGLRVQQYGMMLDVRLDYVQDANNRTVGAAASLAGGRLINKYHVQYPIAVVATHISDNDKPIVNLVSLHTESKDNNTDFIKAYPNAGASPNSPQPDLTTGGSFQFGSKYRLFTAQYSAADSLASFSSQQQDSSTNRELDETLSEDWFEATGVSTGESVYASGTLKVNGADRLLVAGYTRASSGLSFPAGSKTAGDVNGFVATRHWNNGSYVEGVPTVLVQSTDGGDDYLQGMCQCEGTTPSNAFYVVGYTNGTFAKAILKPTKSLVVTAFLVKLDALSLDTIWVQQLSAPNLAAEVRGIACTVSNDNDVVYVAGNIKGNASFDQQTAYGQDDIFVAQLATDNGNIHYIRQMGSPANDRLARGGIVTDAKGNAILLANTEGDWFRVRSKEESSAGHAPYSDMVLLSVSKADGSFRKPGALPTVPPNKPPNVGSPASGNVPPPRRMAFMTLVIVAIVAMGIFAIVRITQQPNELVETDRTKVLAYLRDFDVEDIDLRHSATGGWHCTYASNPAEKEHYRYFGIGGDEDDDDDDEEERRLQGRSGLIRDAAYVDPLHAPLAPINPLLGKSPAVRSPKSTGRSSPPVGGLTQISLLSEDSESKASKRNRRRGGGGSSNHHHHHHHHQQQHHGLMDAYNDTSLQPLGGDILPSTPPSRSTKSSRSKSLNDETWGKEII